MKSTTLSNSNLPEGRGPLMVIVIIFCFLLFVVGTALCSCTKFENNVNNVNHLTVIEGDSIVINPPDIDIHIDIIDSSTIVIGGDTIIINITVPITIKDTTTIIIGGDTIIIDVNIVNPPQKCDLIATAPLIGNIIQPSNGKSGSVVLYGLPVDTWTLIRLPDKEIVSGSGGVTLVTGLTAKKCNTVIYSWIVINKCGSISPVSKEISITQ
jgi:hypothetical protein